jgi:hypothetical protein
VKRYALIAAAVAGAGLSLPVSAVSVDWLTQTGGGQTTGLTYNTRQYSVTQGSDTYTIKVDGYSTPGIGSQGTIGPSGGNWLHAQTAVYSTSGIGVKNSLAGSCSGTSCDNQEGNSPEHAVDNEQVRDVVVYELPDSDWAITKLGIGWRDSGYFSDNRVDVQVWIGGTSTIDFTKVCFSSCTGMAQQLVSGYGFESLGTLTFTSNTTKTFTYTDPSDPPTGRYVVVAGGTGNTKWDAFKLNVIGAQQFPGTPPPGVPEPGVLALLMGGLFGLAHIRRKRA